MSAEYKAKLDAHPDDAVFLYLYGLSLMGADTPTAIEYFQRASAKDPALPWPYWSLMDVYASAVYKDLEKLAANMRRVNDLCPEDGGASALLHRIEDKATLRELAARFRKTVETRGGSGVANLYPQLWQAEFRAADPKDFCQLRLRASEQWAKDFPEETNALYWRMISLRQIKSPDKAAVEEAGEAVLACDARHKPAWTQLPYSLQVAEVWNGLDISLEDCVKLAARGLAELDAVPISQNDMRKAPARPSGPGMDWNVSLQRFRAWSVEAEASRKLNHLDETRSAIAEMKAWIARNHPETANFQVTNLRQTAGLAQAEGRKLDALAGYQRALLLAGYDTGDKDRARALWLELGGAQDGFATWYAHPPASKPPNLDLNKTGWTKLDRPLALNAPDLSGRTWTVADLRGKKTFINVWATWCAPCREELPEVQKLYEQMRERKDVQLITISIDYELGLVGPFMQQNHYTFPVIFASELAEKISPELGVPRSWISDADGKLRLQRVGFDARDGLAETLQILSSDLKQNGYRSAFHRIVAAHVRYDWCLRVIAYEGAVTCSISHSGAE